MLLVALALASPPPVLGGTPAPDGKWPDAVAIFSGTTHICTGTLIAPDLVLTAEHCYAPTHVRVGVTDYATQGEDVAVVERYDHADPQSTYDVAVLRLEGPVPQEPRDLLVDCLSGFYVDGHAVTVAGFGYTDPVGPAQTQLVEVTVPIDDADCSDLSRGCRPTVSPGGELVAGGEGLDSCIGDSGGPLYLDTGAGIYLAGVVSRGATPFDELCGDGGIYVRADAIAPWIEDVTGITLDRPDGCEAFNRPPRPTAAPVEVTQGRSARIVVDPDDPDAEDTHTLVLLEGPERGRVSADLVFTAEPFQVGADRILVEVRDSGSPPQSARVEVPIHVFPAGVLSDPLTGDPPGACAVRPHAVGSSILPGITGLFTALSRQRE